ncbi:MAG TPA: outer membrane beta-barrel protein [Patescibacteria group bacterium]|nr:outer membrane beta-barrel protein [Patescibacteria group bacterium]
MMPAHVVKIAENTWIEAGIFPSHIGFESAISKDNPTYSRSLVAELSPYYEAGVKATTTFKNFSFQALILNGWQNIRENNTDKAFGTQLQYAPVEKTVLNWSTFYGNEQPRDSASKPRIFNNVYIQFPIAEVSLTAGADIGFQKNPGNSYDSWWGAVFIARMLFLKDFAIAGRAEYFSDPQGIVASTGTINNFQVFSASVNIDYAVRENILARLEGRIFNSKDKIYRSRNSNSASDRFIAASMTITF